MIKPLIQFVIIAFISNVLAQLDSGCICVPYFLCDADKQEIIRDESADIINPRSILECKESTEVCCKIPKDENDGPQKTKIQAKCGIWNQGDKFPWRIFISDLHDNIFGVGSLIHPRVALTSANAVLNLLPKKIKIKFAAGNILALDEKKVENIIIHPHYGWKNYQNDIALIIFDDDIEYTHNIRPLCLPKEDENLKSAKDCFTTCENEDSFENMVKVKTLDSNKCQRAFGHFLNRNFQLHHSFVCAYNSKNGHAFQGKGVNGAALVCPVLNKTNQYQQVGIYSWGLNGAPSIYSHVSKFIKWIDSEIDKLQLDKFDYLIM